MNTIQIEVCANSVQSALAAQQGGASRVELCDNLLEGGTTPSAGAIKLARKLLQIELNVILRPRGGDFNYSNEEFEIIKEDLKMCKDLGVDGVVIGFLLPDGCIDTEKTLEIVQLARPMSVTFHRAFDMCCNPFDALKKLQNCGVDRILTSGLKNKAIDGATLLRELVSKAQSKPIIMPGSGINETNIEQLKQQTGASEFHVSGRKTVQSKMKFKREHINMGGHPDVAEFEISVTDSNRIQKIVTLAQR